MCSQNEVKNKNINFKSNWNEELAIKFAKQESIIMTKKHWEIIYIIRNFYLKFNITPSMRMLIKILNKKLFNKNQYSSRYLFKLFPNDPIAQSCKIAGIPKYRNCF